jgi:hypothetical protein
LDSYSYGKVTVIKVGGIAKIVLKDGDKNILHDDVNPSIECNKSFGKSDFPISSSQIKSLTKSNDTGEIEKLWKDLQGENSSIKEEQIIMEEQTNPQTDLNGLNSNPFG